MSNEAKMIQLSDHAIRVVGRERAKIAMSILRAVTLANPVRTGRMRAGWVVSAGAPSRFVPPEVKLKFGSAKGSRSASRAIASSIRTMAQRSTGQATGSLSSVPLDTPIYVTNNVSYAGHVNDHHPTRAGFVQAAVANVVSAYNASVGRA